MRKFNSKVLQFQQLSLLYINAQSEEASPVWSIDHSKNELSSAPSHIPRLVTLLRLISPNTNVLCSYLAQSHKQWCRRLVQSFHINKLFEHIHAILQNGLGQMVCRRPRMILARNIYQLAVFRYILLTVFPHFRPNELSSNLSPL